MGCADSRPTKIEVEETILGPFEDSLGYTGQNSIDLDNTFHRYSRKGFMTIKHLNQALTLSKLPFTQFSDFYELFEQSHSDNVYEKLYSTDLLKTLSLLLSKATNEQKILILFKNYDVEASKVIDKKTVLIMIYNIFLVALETIPYYCKAKHPNNSLLEEYITILEKNKKKFMTQIYKEITKGHSTLKFEDFKKNCLNSSVQELFSVKLLRKSIAESDKKKVSKRKSDDLSEYFDASDEDESINIDVLLNEALMKNNEKTKHINSVNQYKINIAKALVEKNIHENDNAKSTERNSRNSRKMDRLGKKGGRRSSLKPIAPIDEIQSNEIEEIYAEAFRTPRFDSSSTERFSGQVSQYNKDESSRDDTLKLKKHAVKAESNEKKASRKK